MCGIVGYVGTSNGVPIVLEGLQRLEYRGYDSSGLAVAAPSGLKVHKAKGRVSDLKAALPKRIKGSPAIGHTRWATHGAPTDGNAHPHVDFSGRFAVVHNGIIENAPQIRERLLADGITPQSETDTELVAHLIGQAAVDSDDPVDALRAALRRVEGAYGLAVLDAKHPDRIVVARLGSPIVLGLGDREMYVASDVGAIVRHTRQVVHLEDGEIALLEPEGFTTSTLDARPVQKVSERVDMDDEHFDLGEHDHFLRKEIGEQPEAVERTLSGRLDERFSTIKLGGLNLEPNELRSFKRVYILGCGSAYYSGEVGAQLIEELARNSLAASAVSLAEASGAPRHVARGLLLEGVGLVEKGDLDGATATLRRAATLAESLGTLPLLWRSRALLGALTTLSSPDESARALASARTCVLQVAEDLPEDIRADWLARPDVLALLEG